MTREEWLRALTVRLRPDFSRHEVELPEEVAVSCGWPSHKALSRNGRVLGQCWRADCSAGARPEIFISPTLADSIEVGHVLVHELIHAALPNAGHRATFKRAAVKLGLTRKMTATIPTEELRGHLALLIDGLGAYPHAELRAIVERKQGTRLLKLECPDCGYVIRTTRKWLEEGGLPTCPCGELYQVAA